MDKVMGFSNLKKPVEPKYSVFYNVCVLTFMYYTVRYFTGIFYAVSYKANFCYL